MSRENHYKTHTMESAPQDPKVCSNPIGAAVALTEKDNERVGKLLENQTFRQGRGVPAYSSI